MSERASVNDQKIENLLNLSLDASEAEREKSEMLETGYDPWTRTWQVIVRYHGDLAANTKPDWEVILLTGGYAIITLPQSDLETLAALPEIEYVEKPKRLYFSVNQGRAASCISALQTAQYDLFGKGILVAVIDSGVDYFHPDFRDEEGRSRIVAIWDQTGRKNPENSEEEASEESEVENLEEEVSGESEAENPEEEVSGESEMENPEEEISGEPEVENLREEVSEGPERENGPMFVYRPPEGFTQGIEYTQEMINAALAQKSRETAYRIVPEQDLSGHGTQVLGIAAGNGRVSGGLYRGVAPQADILVVKLGVPQPGGFPRTTELMQAVEYVVKKAQQLDMPVVINLSFGNAYGSHRGNSLLETYLDMMADRWKNVIVTGTGNEGNTGGHFAGNLKDESAFVPGAAGQMQQIIEFAVGEGERTLNLQLWKNYADDFKITIVHPNTRSAGPLGSEVGTARYRLGQTELLVYYGEPSPYQGQQEIYIDFLPADTYIDSGIWRILLTPRRIVSGEYEIWMPDSRARNSGTYFLQPSQDTTLTIPSTASRLISVGAYDSRRMIYAPFSGRGWETEPYYNKPDLAAPGVNITTTAPGGGYTSVTGTSFAAPFVTGAAALLMEWGIVLNKDQFLYGEKVKAYLQRGARQLPGYKVWPNNQLGYGALCLRDSFPE